MISLSGQRHVSLDEAEMTTTFNIWGSWRMESDQKNGSEEETGVRRDLVLYKKDKDP